MLANNGNRRISYNGLHYLFCEPMRLNIRSYFLDTHHVIHIVKRWVGGNAVVIRLLIVVRPVGDQFLLAFVRYNFTDSTSRRVTPPGNFPQNKTEGINISCFKGFEGRFVKAFVQHFWGHVATSSNARIGCNINFVGFTKFREKNVFQSTVRGSTTLNITLCI